MVMADALPIIDTAADNRSARNTRLSRQTSALDAPPRALVDLARPAEPLRSANYVDVFTRAVEIFNRPLPRVEQSTVLQDWEGVVEEVLGDSFVARLRDRSDTSEF